MTWAQGIALGYLALSLVVMWTKRTDDDAFFKRVLHRLSLFNPDNVEGLFSMPGMVPSPSSGRRDMVGVLALVSALAGLFLGGCGGGQVRAYAATAEAMDQALEVSAAQMEERERAEIREAVDEACARVLDRDACIDLQGELVARRFLPWQGAHNAADAAMHLFVVAAEEGGEMSQRFLGAALDAFVKLGRMLRDLGVSLPPIPGVSL